MANKKNLIKAAIKQLEYERNIYCKQYDLCSSCPCLLIGGYCEIKLAIKQLNNELRQENQ